MAASSSSRLWLQVNDLKQYLYCPRIVFYNNVMPVERKSTFKMDSGQRAQDRIEELELRRKLVRYGIAEGERKFRVYLKSARLGMSGMLDALIVDEGGRYYPLDYKETDSGPQANHRIQLCAYGILVEDHFQTSVERAFLYALRSDEVFEVPLDQPLRRRTEGALQAIREMVGREQMPEPADNPRKCENCEFRNFCGDVF